MKTVNCPTLKEWLKKNEAVLIDVREIVENNESRIKGSHLIPLGTVDVDKLPKIDGKKLVVHCKMGGRSAAACERLLAQNPDLDIYNLEGGITAWKNCGFDVEAGEKKSLPIERQVQITIGSFTLIGSLLGFFVSELFFIIPLFLGAGLIFAGTTGWCGLAMLLAKLPFNQKNSQNFCQTKLKM